jgi:hypothetical protein
VVVDQLAATVGKDRRAAGEACPLLLAIVGGEPSHAALVRKHAAADGGAAGASGVVEELGNKYGRKGGKRRSCV